MPSTHRRRLSDFIKAFARSGTSNLDQMETQKVQTRVVEAASTTENRCLFNARSACAIKRVRFLPELAVTSASGTKWVLTFTSASISTGNTFSTYSSDSSTINAPLVQYTALDVYVAPAGEEVVLAAGEMLQVAAAKTGSPASLQGSFVVEWVPLID